MKEDNEEIKIFFGSQHLLTFNKKSEKFLLKNNYYVTFCNGEDFTLNEDTKLTLENVKKVCEFYYYVDRHLRSNFRDITDEQKEAIFKFFEKANKYLLKKEAVPEIQKYLGDKVFYYKIENRDNCLEAKNYKREKKYEMYLNKYPRWFSLFGGLNFDYDYFLKCPEEPLHYFKLDETGQEQFEEKRSDLIQTRNNNGWIVKDGWIDKVGNSCCNCDNNKADININNSIDSETWKKSAI